MKASEYPCEQCEFNASTPRNLKRHIESIHEGIRYPCDLCKYSSTTLSDLKRHKGNKHEGAKYLCDQCEYSAAALSYKVKFLNQFKDTEKN